jgi:PAS domain S-box-containing protein
MTLKARLSLMLSLFFVLIAILSVGSMSIFQRISEHMGALRSVSEETKRYNELDRNIGDLVDATRGWGLTGDAKYKKQYFMKTSDVRESLEKVIKGAKKTETETIDLLDKETQQILQYAEVVIRIRQPRGNNEVIDYLRNIDTIALDIIKKIDGMQEYSTDRILDVLIVSEALKGKMLSYYGVLILFSCLATVFLVISIRKTISVPFKELLKATARISKGDMSYRIGMDRNDEFGTIAKRFDAMVMELELSNSKITQKLTETLLLLDITKMGSATLDIKDALQYIAEIISFRLRHDNCALFLLNTEQNAFCAEASNVMVEGVDRECFAVENDVMQEMIKKLSPVSISDGSRKDESAILSRYKTALAVPMVRDGACVGLLLIRRLSPYTFSSDETDTFIILSHNIESIVRNAELFQSTKKQLKKLTVLYEMSSAVTSVLDLDELLQKIATEIARLLSSRGCIIRLIEGDKLKIKTCYGLPEGIEQEMELSMGDGIAGWVAANDKPLLVEDAGKMPQNMRVPMIPVKTVICVPLKSGERVIGTLGLYDKYDLLGNIIPFTAEDLGTVEGFASISSIAIERSKIYESELKREQQFDEDRKRLNVLFDSVQGGIVTLDREYVITSVNKYIEEWISTPAADLIGRSALDIFHDKIGICPHCAAKATFETGEINSIMQSRGVNYAELTAYAIRNDAGEIAEVVVFIMDITERVLYQEETLGLYREVIQTKEYLESIISNSADAIVTSDLDGLVTSWNHGAERIFGFSESEVTGAFLPFVPDFLLEKEKENLEEIKRGEVLRDIETLRKKKDGSVIEVSLTLSPIKDAVGDVIGVSGISRDISEKKRVEKELIKKNQEISRLFFISSAMRSTLELDALLRMVLTAVTMSEGMGFNRAILFLIDESRNVLKGFMGVGPASSEEAWKIWDDISLKHKSLNEVMQDIASNQIKKDSFFEKLSVGLEIPLEGSGALISSVKERRPLNIPDVREDPLADAVLIQQLGTQAYAVVPLISRGKVIGLIWVDNYFNRKPILEEDMQFLAGFSNHVASAIESARLFEKVTMAEQQLENIFESISDMVYFVDKDYEIKNINRAVSKKMDLPASEIIGKKCYEIFHGTHEPSVRCPHHKTVNTKLAYIEELDEPYLGGTFLTSSSPIFDSAGEFIGSVHVVRDISELKVLREKLATSEKMAALGEVAAKVAHEIRNPLVSVGGFAKRLERKLEGNLKEYARIIVKEVGRLEGILKEILGFVKEVRLSRERISFNSIVSEVLKLMASDISERGILLVRDYGESPELFIDPNRVKEAIFNIVSNAIQSISGSGSIHIRTYTEKNDAVLEIRDTGSGISEEDQTFIFNPFYTTKSSGTGLGLAITHRIIQEHNGRIEVESEIGKGTTFRVFIPIKEGAK